MAARTGKVATPSLLAAALANAVADPAHVTFPADDGRTTLEAYLFAPTQPRPAMPAVVMMHGSGGVYSSAAKGNFNASTLSARHLAWGKLWAERGYLALLADGFTPRGFPAGFGFRSYGSRPPEVDEVESRPRDAHAAARYLRGRPAVAADRIGLIGWSNGGSAALVALASDTPGLANPTPQTGFRAGLAFYPGCWLKRRYAEGYRCYAPVRVFAGAADTVVKCEHCVRLVEMGRAAGADIELTTYDGAGHGFDDPKRPSGANGRASAEAVPAAIAFFARELGG